MARLVGTVSYEPRTFEKDGQTVPYQQMVVTTLNGEKVDVTRKECWPASGSNVVLVKEASFGGGKDRIIIEFVGELDEKAMIGLAKG